MKPTLTVLRQAKLLGVTVTQTAPDNYEVQVNGSVLGGGRPSGDTRYLRLTGAESRDLRDVLTAIWTAANAGTEAEELHPRGA